jgi:hypothetical protein
MTIRIFKMTLIVILGPLVFGCSSRHAPFNGMVPAIATNVRYLYQSWASTSVTFHVISATKSYQYIDAVRDALNKAALRSDLLP